ncbi:hypothetical protein LTSEADE_5581 [Salmonella enterica subsp. enterica serovar Adelaide str. A4-669]|uniref:Capsid protein n=1 Tax=Salmonella enterica subsp. enterica serovar Adelaide str. A4-669 TaxID=913063 RepID=A0A6C8GFD5_SALET|nr:hypothetical protein LTSEADE_5581 [Salmonella enterica subsp. enterica serovar Adelaide str. A4-669]
MRPETRFKFNAYLTRVAELNNISTDDVELNNISTDVLMTSAKNLPSNRRSHRR